MGWQIKHDTVDSQRVAQNVSDLSGDVLEVNLLIVDLSTTKT